VNNVPTLCSQSPWLKESATKLAPEYEREIKTWDCKILRKELERKVATEPEVFGFVDHTHASTTDLAKYVIVRNHLPHWTAIYEQAPAIHKAFTWRC
jgi:hypothetical protein